MAKERGSGGSYGGKSREEYYADVIGKEFQEKSADSRFGKVGSRQRDKNIGEGTPKTNDSKLKARPNTLAQDYVDKKVFTPQNGTSRRNDMKKGMDAIRSTGEKKGDTKKAPAVIEKAEQKQPSSVQMKLNFKKEKKNNKNDMVLDDRSRSINDKNTSTQNYDKSGKKILKVKAGNKKSSGTTEDKNKKKNKNSAQKIAQVFTQANNVKRK